MEDRVHSVNLEGTDKEERERREVRRGKGSGWGRNMGTKCNEGREKWEKRSDYIWIYIVPVAIQDHISL